MREPQPAKSLEFIRAESGEINSHFQSLQSEMSGNSNSGAIRAASHGGAELVGESYG
jgi:hypothetical protein